MKLFSNHVVATAIASLALAGAFLHPAAHAQTPASSPAASSPMPAGKASSPAMSSGAMGMSGMGMKGMDMKGMMKDSNDKMSAMKMTGNADVDFATMMRMHHQGAIDMAQAQLRDGKSPEMKKMATSIIAAQKKEMAMFDKFLAKQSAGDKQMTK